MSIHHNVLAKAQRNGIEIRDVGSSFECWKGDVKLAEDVNARDALAAAIVELNAKTPKEDDMAKTAKKAAKRGKAKKNGAAAVAKGKTIVKDEYRANYTKDDNCGDAVAKAITAYVKVDGALDMDRLKKLAEDNDLSLSKWSGLNNGQKSMNLRNVLRARSKRGEKVKIAGRIFE